jgi:hypothetical protein
VQSHHWFVTFLAERPLETFRVACLRMLTLDAVTGRWAVGFARVRVNHVLLSQPKLTP